MRSHYFLFFILTILCVSVQATENNDTTFRAFKKAGLGPETTVNKTLLLELVNKIRAKGCQCGDTYYSPAPALIWNEKLEQAALQHSTYMYKTNYFTHIESDGSTGGTRIENAGYNWKAYGENIGMGYTDEKQVMEGWVKSPGHCKNLMNKTYKEMGVARQGNYWTQDFAAQ